MSPPLDRSMSCWSLNSIAAVRGPGGGPAEGVAGAGAAGVPAVGPAGAGAEAGGCGVFFSVCSCEGTRREVSLISPPLPCPQQSQDEPLPWCGPVPEPGLQIML